MCFDFLPLDRQIPSSLPIIPMLRLSEDVKNESLQLLPFIDYLALNFDFEISQQYGIDSQEKDISVKVFWREHLWNCGMKKQITYLGFHQSR